MIIIRQAGQEDNSALVALARQTPMGGTISVRVDRDPDFFRMIRARGGGIVLAACEGRQIAAWRAVPFPDPARSAIIHTAEALGPWPEVSGATQGRAV